MNRTTLWTLEGKDKDGEPQWTHSYFIQEWFFDWWLASLRMKRKHFFLEYN